MSEQQADLILIPDVCPTVYGWLTKQNEAALWLLICPSSCCLRGPVQLPVLMHCSITKISVCWSQRGEKGARTTAHKTTDCIKRCRKMFVSQLNEALIFSLSVMWHGVQASATIRKNMKLRVVQRWSTVSQLHTSIPWTFTSYWIISPLEDVYTWSEHPSWVFRSQVTTHPQTPLTNRTFLRCVDWEEGQQTLQNFAMTNLKSLVSSCKFGSELNTLGSFFTCKKCQFVPEQLYQLSASVSKMCLTSQHLAF